MQMKTWTFGRITLACALAGVLAAIAISFAWPDNYVSEAKLKITPARIPESGSPAAANQLMWDRVLSMDHEILSRASLTSIVQRYNLYPRERTRLPLEDVVENMRTHIRVSPITPPGNRAIPAFAIQFEYPDARVAQQVTAELMSRFIDMNVMQSANDEFRANHGRGDSTLNLLSQMRLEPLDTATLPTGPFEPNRAAIAGAGLFAGLLAGLTLAMVIRSRRRTTICPTCGQRVAASVASEPRL